MKDPIEREDAIKYCKLKADHYRKRLARIEAQGDAISYDPTEQINGFKDEIAIYESFVKELEDIPSAEPKQGEWIYCEDDEGQDGYRCSECGFFVPWYYGYEDINYIYKYHACPSCMAMMKGAD